MHGRHKMCNMYNMHVYNMYNNTVYNMHMYNVYNNTMYGSRGK